jgi:hypothetical protein
MLPESLLVQIFPKIEQWEAADIEKPLYIFELFKYLRVVLIQDSVLLKKKLPNHYGLPP